jgi:serine/threonine protein phosphatase PrpC
MVMQPITAAGLLIAQTDLTEPQAYRFGDGEVVLFSRRAPNKESVNEDCLALLPYDDHSGVLLVADGLGGQPHGQSASKLAAQTLNRLVRKAARHKLPLRDAILDGIEKANQAILSQHRGAGTTLALIELHSDRVRPYHVGDSLILLLGQRGLRKLQSIAHSPVGYAVEAGVLDVDEAVHHEERHLVSNILGSAELHIQVGIGKRLARHDTLLLASDGLADNLYEDEIDAIIRKGPLPEAAQRLCELADTRMREPASGQPSHPDDLSFILFRQTRHEI